MILSGDLEETEVRTLERGAKEKRMPFMRGSTDLFLMTVPRLVSMFYFNLFFLPI